MSLDSRATLSGVAQAEGKLPSVLGERSLPTHSIASAGSCYPRDLPRLAALCHGLGTAEADAEIGGCDTNTLWAFNLKYCLFCLAIPTTTAPAEQSCCSELSAEAGGDWEPVPNLSSCTPGPSHAPSLSRGSKCCRWTHEQPFQSIQWLQSKCLAHPPLFWIVTALRHSQKHNQFLKFPDYMLLKSNWQ